MTAQAVERAASPWKTWGSRLLLLAVLGLMAFLLQKTLGRYSLDELMAAVRAVPALNIGLAGAFAASSYACLTLFDTMALRYAGHRIPYPYIALTSFVSLGIGHSIGLAGLSSGAIRYRFYRRFGLKVGEVAKVILFSGLTVAVGLASLAAIMLLGWPGLGMKVLGLPLSGILALGGACLAGVAGYLALAALARKPLVIRRVEFQMPPLRLALAQVAVGTLNFALVSATLYQVISAVADMPFAGVASVYVLANVATLVTHVPGGLGVIESLVTHLVSGTSVIGAVLVFRLVYFLIPLGLGCIALLLSELFIRRPPRMPADG